LDRQMNTIQKALRLFAKSDGKSRFETIEISLELQLIRPH